MDTELIMKAIPLLLEATVLTIELGVLSYALGVLLGLIIALLGVSKLRVLSRIAVTYITIFRGIPALILLFAIYFGFPQIGWEITPFVAGVIGLGVNVSAFIAEAFRSGIQAIGKGQYEAGASLGMTRIQVMYHIVLPQAVRVAIPTLGNEFIAVTKDTSLVSSITVTELTLSAQRLVAFTYKPLEIYLVSAGIYIILSILITAGGKALEGRYKWKIDN